MTFGICGILTRIVYNVVEQIIYAYGMKSYFWNTSHPKNTSDFSCGISYQQIQRMSVCYWPVIEPRLYSPDKFPCFIFYAPCGRRDFHVYGFPSFEYPDLIKVKYLQ